MASKIAIVAFMVIAGLVITSNAGCVENCESKIGWCIQNCSNLLCSLNCNNIFYACKKRCRANTNPSSLRNKNDRTKRDVACSRKCLGVIMKCVKNKINLMRCVSILKPSCIKSCGI